MAPPSTQPQPTLPLIAAFADDRVTIAITGADRLTWLNGLVTCDLKKLGARQGAYGLFVGKNGRIQADVAVVQRGETLLLSVPASREEKLLQIFDTYLVMEDAEVAVSSDFAWIRVVGPGADALGTEAADAVRLDWIGHEGAAIVVPRGELPRALADVESAGATLVDEAAWAAWCARLGVPRFGLDFDESTYPQEASLEKRAVSFTKGCYLGQEVVHTLEVRGRAARRLLPILIEAPESATGLGGAELSANGVVAGKVTSVLFDPAAEAWLGLAIAKVAAVGEGSGLQVASFPATLRTLA